MMAVKAQDKMNFYEILEVAPDAPQNEIHKAYQRAKATYSQDNPALYSMFSRDEARDLLRMIDEAYAVLGNQTLRKNYDSALVTAGGMPAPSMTPSAAPSAASIAAHNSLPDFVVPDPSIPGSMEAVSTIKPVEQVVTPVSVSVPVAVSAPASAPAAAATTVIAANEEFTVRKRDTTQAPADGMGRCPLGVYKIDPTFESEISERTEFDGPYLKKIREYKQVPMEKLSDASRIGKTYLIALESNDYKNLPAPVFLRGFLVQVARQLGLDEPKVVNSYMKTMKSAGK